MSDPDYNYTFYVTWAMSDPDYNYTVIWTNLNTSVMNNFTVPQNTNSYIVTGLSDIYNYNVSVAAVGVCGITTSDPIIINCECVYACICMYTKLSS